ncbi:MAG TPA: response regulator transcription factor [Ottowia sp.]|uniref:response regulator transcription factor n=1 Tax=Ottowia sp. TaxID=1898956 RepID=UPI002C173747|nr:response regulator transcription factor [Ottowia sp.]HMN21844.1 response regulator transcription factor [Ottowia sp.]
MNPLDGFSVLLVDDHPLFRDGLAAALRHRAPGLRVQTAASLDDALRALGAAADDFDLVLLDYRLPGTDGLQCARRIMRAWPDLGVGLMSGMEDPALPERARRAGLAAYLPKTLEIEALIELLKQLAAGQPVFANSESAPLPHEESESPLNLTPRQIEVLQQLALGSSNKEIARAIGISPATVKNHLEAIFARIGASNRLHAVAIARAALALDEDVL